ncbi:hypothetical protein H7B90_29425 [Cohnella xylanilytica]|uniref:Uncharacterized protein n=1 Tax=Cohnella xylanilytica TaxID=557555 RepID=A0A841U942_9BACL|nr:hypothetical protein [Cohnella xylanilytica]MBB6695518.1 hypothetical protein [Cohnella xylanilytica]
MNPLKPLPKSADRTPLRVNEYERHLLQWIWTSDRFDAIMESLLMEIDRLGKLRDEWKERRKTKEFDSFVEMHEIASSRIEDIARKIKDLHDFREQLSRVRANASKRKRG